MYIDKDTNGNLSIMEISPAEAKELGAILLEFERLINLESFLSKRERASHALAAAKLRFKLIDSLYEQS
jgi:hypothetical protein